MEAVAVLAVPLIESENLLVKVAEQMKRLDAHIGSLEATLEKRPKVLYAVGMNLAVNVLLRVVNHLMDVLLMKAAITLPCVREEFRARFDITSHFGVQGQLRSVVDNLRSHLAVALQESHDGNLARAARTRNLSAVLAPVHVAGEAADVSLIRFDLAAHFLLERTRLHRNADAVNHEPSGLLRDADSAVDFVRTDAVLAVRHHPNCHEPLVQTEGRVLEDGSDLDAELTARVCALTLPLALIRQKGNVRASARRADDAVRPAAGNQVVKAVIRIREEYDCLLERLRGGLLRHHAEILA